MAKVLFRLSLLLSLFTLYGYGDEVRPSYFELTEQSPNHFAVVLKVPAKGDKKLSIRAILPPSCATILKKNSRFTKGAYLERWYVKCTNGLENETISIQGLENSSTDLLLRIDRINGTSYSTLLSSTKSEYIVPKVASSTEVMKTYTWLGITHILLGFDHLLFVFALLLIVKNMRRLLWTITAFTFAHSITMAGATLGFISLPQAPVEAMIALSILFLAMEIIHERQGKVGLTSRYPWLIAFIFGLLHGFGFAGALAEVGLPQHAISIALLFFNIGVELGQLLFVAMVVFISVLLQHLHYPNLVQKVETIVVYAIGTLSAFWVFDRISWF